MKSPVDVNSCRRKAGVWRVWDAISSTALERGREALRAPRTGEREPASQLLRDRGVTGRIVLQV